jgi:phage FluMu protein gp41
MFIMTLCLISGTAYISNGLEQKKSFGAASEGFQLSAMMDGIKLKRGEPILLKLTLKNVSQKELFVAESTAEKVYDIDVRDERGELVPLSEKGKRLYREPIMFDGVISVKVAPGQEQNVTIDLSKIYNVTATGIYSVTARRTVPKLDRSGTAELVSNTVKVTIY